MNLQVKSSDGRVRLRVAGLRATLTVENEKVAEYEVETVDVLTASAARRLGGEAGPATLVVYRRSSPEGRTVLRKRGVPFVGADGELYLHDPPLHIELPASRPPGPSPFRAAPFATKASRIGRWLLLNPAAEPTFRELSTRLELSEALVSRTVRALADERLAEVSIDRRDARARRVRAPDPGALLDAFERSTRGAVRSSIWDVGARDADGALERLQRAVKRWKVGYAVGGLAGAGLHRRVVDPVVVDVWIPRDEYPVLFDEMLPTVTDRRGPGCLVVNLLPDSFVLSLATPIEGLVVADPVQLYVDCSRAGERALEAAEAIRSEMGW